MGLTALLGGNLGCWIVNFHLYCTVYGVCHRQSTLWPLGRILFETFYCLPLSSSYKTAHGHWPHVNVCRVSCGGVVNMMLVFWITSFFITKNGVVCVQLAHFSMVDCKDVPIAHVIIIIKSEVSTFPIVIKFFRGCVSEMFVTSYSVTYCIYIPGKPGICFRYYCAVYDECK